MNWTPALQSTAGTVTSFSAGGLSPLFTTSVATPTTTPALSFSLATAAQNAVFAGPGSGGTVAASTTNFAFMTCLDVAGNQTAGATDVIDFACTAF